MNETKYIVIFLLPEPQKISRACTSNIIKTDKKPYLVTVTYTCEDELEDGDSGRKFGAIISNNYVLTSLNKQVQSGKCDFTVLVGADAHNQGGKKYNAELKKIKRNENLSLLELEEPLTFDSNAQPIELIDQKPKKGEQATMTILVGNPGSERILGNFRTSFTISDVNDCKELLYLRSDIEEFSSFSNSFCNVPFQYNCPSNDDSVVIIRDKLAGFMNRVYFTESVEPLFSISDVAHLKDEIENIAGI
ncbi:hypothetical protein QAD02_009935 [Eretmocerus hayati]|uniref:Uncharacterized protein n=1 Tax=Eretmocerus hayati TaxID=131215 RepID=A0ACC2NB16_9HYME|nr:hypothetical protein QAD02_009935 [Eretmocerus hayati]